MALAEARYHAQHQALVNHLLANVPDQSMVGDHNQPVSAWLQALFSDTLPDSLGLRIDTLERHTKMPLLELGTNGSVDPTRALRTEVSPMDQNWILTTVPSPEGLEAVAQASRRTVWIAGAALSVFAAALTLVLNRRLHRQTLHIRGLEQREIGADHQIANFQVEKSILRRALNDSEQRSRDLVALSGAVIWELDERGRIGFVSPQIAELLDQAPADLVNQPLEALFDLYSSGLLAFLLGQEAVPSNDFAFYSTLFLTGPLVDPELWSIYDKSTERTSRKRTSSSRRRTTHTEKTSTVSCSSSVALACRQSRRQFQYSSRQASHPCHPPKFLLLKFRQRTECSAPKPMLWRNKSSHHWWLGCRLAATKPK